MLLLPGKAPMVWIGTPEAAPWVTRGQTQPAWSDAHRGAQLLTAAAIVPLTIAAPSPSEATDQAIETFPFLAINGKVGHAAPMKHKGLRVTLIAIWSQILIAK
jgi:hypothetical protein